MNSERFGTRSLLAIHGASSVDNSHDPKAKGSWKL